MLTVLQIVIGIVFILLLFSLLATTVMELVSGLLTLRGNHLLSSLKNMLGKQYVEFIDHPLYKQLCEDAASHKFITHRALPSYMSPQTFRAILFDTYHINDKLEAGGNILEDIKDVELQRLMAFWWKEAQGDVKRFERNIELWFNQVMERTSDWYKRKTQYYLIGIGATIALLFNVDSLNIYKTLSRDASARAQVEQAAMVYMQEKDQSGNIIMRPMTQNAPSQIYGGKEMEIMKSVESPLGLGWDEENIYSFSPSDWARKIIGWLTTALAISLGAPFWFDALRKLVNIRNSGSTPTTPSEGYG